MSENILKQAERIYFIGIGGIGISAIARMLLLEGKIIIGSDRDETKVTEELRKAGAIIFIGQKKENVPKDCDLIIYTNAIGEDNPELIEAKKSGVKMLTYPETLGIISKEKFTIAVAGTHGKTTVTAMVAKVMIDAGLDPTVIVGSFLNRPPSPSLSNEGEAVTNFIMGSSKPVRTGHPGGYLVVEADEYKKSFHNLEPSILVINNLDLDHLDFYKDLADIQDSFLYLAKKLPKHGFLICNTKLPNLQPIINNVQCKVIDYSEIEMTEKLLVPGEHNRQNAKTAFAVAKVLNIDLKRAEKSLSQFTGTWRRFEYKGMMKQNPSADGGALVYDDYAHNPQKVRAALQGAREMFPDKRIVVVFQPHLFSRTKLLLNEFATAFDDADEIILTPIFPAREKFDPTISSEILAGRISAFSKEECHSDDEVVVHSFPDFDSIISYLQSSLGPSDLLITMGAGEQYKIGEALLD